MRGLDRILHESSIRHQHLCPRQVLGARMGLFAGELLHLTLPCLDKQLLVIAETDGCTVDGISAATGCHVGGRTLRIMDLGKVAATFIDVRTGEALRLAPKHEARSLAVNHTPNVDNRWEAMLISYQVIPAAELFSFQPVCLNIPLAEIISTPERKAECAQCGEEIFNGREVNHNGSILCRSCAGQDYYQLKDVSDCSTSTQEELIRKF